MRCGDGYSLLLLGGQIFGGNMNDTISVDIKGDLYLRNAPRCRRNAYQSESSQGYIVLGQGPFALQYIYFDAGLVVGSRGEYLAIASGNGGIPLDQLGSNGSQGFNAE